MRSDQALEVYGLIARYGPSRLPSRQLQRYWKNYSIGETSRTESSSLFFLEVGNMTLGHARAAFGLFPRYGGRRRARRAGLQSSAINNAADA